MSEPPLNRNKEAMSTDPQPIPTDSAKKEAGGIEGTEDLNVSLCYSGSTNHGAAHFHQSFTSTHEFKKSFPNNHFLSRERFLIAVLTVLRFLQNCLMFFLIYLILRNCWAVKILHTHTGILY